MLQTALNIECFIELTAYVSTLAYIGYCWKRKKNDRMKFVISVILQCELIVGRIAYLLLSSMMMAREMRDPNRTFWMIIAAVTIVVSSFVLLVTARENRNNTETKNRKGEQ